MLRTVAPDFGQRQGLLCGLLDQDGSARAQNRHGGQRQQTFQYDHAVHIHSHLCKYAGNDGTARLNAH